MALELVAVFLSFSCRLPAPSTAGAALPSSRDDKVIPMPLRYSTSSSPIRDPEVTILCGRLAGQDANMTTIPVSVLKLT